MYNLLVKLSGGSSWDLCATAEWVFPKDTGHSMMTVPAKKVKLK